MPKKTVKPTALTPRIYIRMEGGIIQDILGLPTGFDAVIFDYDTEGLRRDEVVKIAQSDRTKADAYLRYVANDDSGQIAPEVKQSIDDIVTRQYK